MDEDRLSEEVGPCFGMLGDFEVSRRLRVMASWLAGRFWRRRWARVVM
jgi:hypothetical protein